MNIILQQSTLRAFILAVVIVLSITACSGNKNDSFSLLVENLALHSFDTDLNKRWRIDGDGRVFFVENTASTSIPNSNPALHFDTKFPSLPVVTLANATMKDISKKIDSLDFFNQLTNVVEPSTEDGAVFRVTVYKNKRIHSVSLSNTQNDDVKELIDYINTYLPDQSLIDAHPLW